MSAVLYSEGTLDLGDEDPFGPPEREGALRPLLATILEHPDGLAIESRRLGRVHGDREDHGLKGLARKARRALRDARRDGHDAVFIVVDRDGERGAKRLEDLQRGRYAADARVPSALGVAQEMVESWLLGDTTAWTRAFGQQPHGLPSDPERETGGRGSPRYAKRVLRDLLRSVFPVTSWNEAYAELARHIHCAELERTCNRSFQPFAEEVRKNVGPVFGLTAR